jgi:dTDP-4-amino-4,6-dideoxygalactose transaminase
MSAVHKDLAINGGKPVCKQPVLIHKPFLDEEDEQAVARAVKSTFISGDGPFCREFESALAKYLGMKHVFFTTSCTAALDLAFRIKKFPAGKKVLVPNFTYTSTALGPILNNLNIKLVDVYAGNGNIDITALEAAISPDTVAICPVDYAGNPAEMDEVNALAAKSGLYVVHDTAQSIGSLYKGRKTGTLTPVSTFSFHGTKNISTGEGGALVTDDDHLAEIIKIMREKGTDKYSFISDAKKKGYYEYVDVGNSYVQSNILGAMGITQLRKLDFINDRRRKIAEYYIRELSAIEIIDLPLITKDCMTNWHIFYILVPPAHKNWIIEALKAEGVLVNVHYTPLHLNTYYEPLGKDRHFPNSVKFFNRLVRIPMYPSLSDAEVEDTVRAIKKVMSILE